MADKKNDSLFQWNFNLEDSDSDFTDIDFSSSKKSDASDKDIEPIIFVRDETAKKKTEAKRPQTQTSSTVQSAKKTQSSGSKTAARPASRPAAKKTAKKKKTSSLPAFNWRLIAIIAAAVLLIALLVVLLGKCGKKEEKSWTKVEADSKLKTLMDSYFDAKKNGQANDMRKVLVEDAVVNASVLGIESSIYKDYTDIELQQYPGIKKGEYVVCATYDTVLDRIDASVPTIGWFYALPDSSKNLRLMTTTEMEKPENKTINDYVVAAYSLIQDTTVADVQTRYNNALESNPILKQYLQNIKEGNYYTVPDGTTEAPADSSTESTIAGNVMYVKVGKSTLNMRSTPKVPDKSKGEADNIMQKLSNGYCVTVYSIDEYGWAHIKDDVQVNPATNMQQSPTGKEGYVNATYLTTEFSATN
ncbi:MAG: hypothetical protein IJK77_09275 [Lachnospiraceae bacterium]|nr:hypothetical protein [Lachnospiraceae bacterium]